MGHRRTDERGDRHPKHKGKMWDTEEMMKVKNAEHFGTDESPPTAHRGLVFSYLHHMQYDNIPVDQPGPSTDSGDTLLPASASPVPDTV